MTLNYIIISSSSNSSSSGIICENENELLCMKSWAMVKSGLRICGSADVDIDKLELNFIFRLRVSVRVR